MQQWLWIILLLPVSSLFARDKKLGGYVLDSAAFGKIQSYCIDTHNLPPREVRVVNQFVQRESKPSGLLLRLPWRRLQTCQQGSPDAIVRVEFPPAQYSPIFERNDVNGVLFVFKAGSPTPIYETHEVSMLHAFEGEGEGFDQRILEHDALDSVVRILVHDWQKLSETLNAAATREQ